MRRRLVVRGIVGLIGLTLAVSLCFAGTKPSTPVTSQLVEARIGPFVVYAEGRNTAQRFATRLAEFASVLGERGHEPPPGMPVRVLVVGAEKSFHELAGKPLSPDLHPIGVTLLAKDQPWILIDARERGEDTTSLLYRAYVQLALGMENSPLPAWFREGMAQYYRTFSALGTTAILGRAPKDHVYNLREQPFIPWETFFTMSRADVEKLSYAQRGVFCGQAWLLVHSQFAEGKQGKVRLSELLDVNKGNVVDVIKRAFDTDPEGLSREMRDYLNRSRLTYRQVEEAMHPAGEVTIVGAKTDDVYRQFNAARAVAKEVVTLGSTKEPERFEYPVAQEPRR